MYVNLVAWVHSLGNNSLIRYVAVWERQRLCYWIKPLNCNQALSLLLSLPSWVRYTPSTSSVESLCRSKQHHPFSVYGSFCDLSKAFDTISPNIHILLSKLNTYGIRGVANKWIESYLTNRIQYVDFDSHISTRLPVRSGVPQGSILGPLLITDIY